jgi:hypothetical protein
MALHPYALVVFAGLVACCWENNLPAPVLTSIGRTAEENLAEGAESDSHVTLRAFDISSRPYTMPQIEFIISYMTKKFGHLGAVNDKRQVRLVVYHKTETGAFHFHFQIHGKYRLPPFTGMSDANT